MNKIYKDLITLIEDVKADISDEYRAYPDDEEPGIQLTVAANTMHGFENGEWSFQTGDNSFTGSAYHFQHWAVLGIYRDTDANDAARDIVDQLEELMS